MPMVVVEVDGGKGVLELSRSSEVDERRDMSLIVEYSFEKSRDRLLSQAMTTWCRGAL